jgi:hypothetical protein
MRRGDIAYRRRKDLMGIQREMVRALSDHFRPRRDHAREQGDLDCADDWQATLDPLVDDKLYRLLAARDEFQKADLL